MLGATWRLDLTATRSLSFEMSRVGSSCDRTHTRSCAQRYGVRMPAPMRVPLAAGFALAAILPASYFATGRLSGHCRRATRTRGRRRGRAAHLVRGTGHPLAPRGQAGDQSVVVPAHGNWRSARRQPPPAAAGRRHRLQGRDRDRDAAHSPSREDEGYHQHGPGPGASGSGPRRSRAAPRGRPDRDRVGGGRRPAGTADDACRPSRVAPSCGRPD